MKFCRLSYFVPILAAGALLSSCGGSADKSADGKEFKDAEESLKDQIQDLVYNIPSPSEIPYLLEATGAEFNQTLINDNN